MKNKCENCGKCCLETEMILSFEDIETIKRNSTNNIREQDFIFKNNDKLFQLKNIEGHCVFFDNTTKKCKIYRFRPYGCRFYPLTYDLNTYKCKLDDDCPRKDQFYTTKQSLEDACSNLERFLRNKLNLKI